MFRRYATDDADVASFIAAYREYQLANHDRLILDRVRETDIVTGHDFHGELAFRVNSDPRFERGKTDLKHLADAKRTRVPNGWHGY